MMAVLAIAFVLIIVPILLFGLELIIVGVLLAVGLVSRVVLRRPWIVEARPLDDGVQTESAWKVVGWRKSGAFVDEIAQSLKNGRELPREVAT